MSDQRVVTQVRVMVHSTGPIDPNDSTAMSENHWTITFLVSNSGGSISASMTAPDHENLVGSLEWKPLPTKAEFESVIRSWDYSVVADHVTVEDLRQLMLRNGRDKYRMVEGGSGCRYWVACAGAAG